MKFGNLKENDFQYFNIKHSSIRLVNTAAIITSNIQNSFNPVNIFQYHLNYNTDFILCK